MVFVTYSPNTIYSPLVFERVPPNSIDSYYVLDSEQHPCGRGMTEQPHSQASQLLEMAFAAVTSPGSPLEGARSGPQGMSLANFIQYGAADTSVTGTRWVFNMHEKGNITKRFQHLVEIQVNNSRGTAAPNSTNRRISDVVVPKPGMEGDLKELASGIAPFSEQDPVVRRVQLDCIGGDYRGNNGGSGSNCRRVAFDIGYCSGLGSCSPSCSYLTLKGRQKSAAARRHLCGKQLHLTWTLTSVASGRVAVHWTGRHVPLGTTWVPPTSEAAGITDEARYRAEGGAAASAASGAVKALLGVSPAGQGNKRRNPDAGVLSRVMRDRAYSTARLNVCIGDFSQLDSFSLHCRLQRQ